MLNPKKVKLSPQAYCKAYIMNIFVNWISLRIWHWSSKLMRTLGLDSTSIKDLYEAPTRRTFYPNYSNISTWIQCVSATQTFFLFSKFWAILWPKFMFIYPQQFISYILLMYSAIIFVFTCILNIVQIFAWKRYFIKSPRRLNFNW